MSATIALPKNKIIADVLKALGVDTVNSGVSTGARSMKGEGSLLESSSPVDGALIGSVRGASRSEYEAVLATAQGGFEEWPTWPAPKGGEIVRQLRKERKPVRTSTADFAARAAPPPPRRVRNAART